MTTSLSISPQTSSVSPTELTVDLASVYEVTNTGTVVVIVRPKSSLTTGDWVNVQPRKSVTLSITGEKINAIDFYVAGSSNSTETWVPPGKISARAVVSESSFGEIVQDNLVPTADNTVPDLSQTPVDSTAVQFYINGVYDYRAQISADGAGAVTVAGTVFAEYGFNITTSDIVSAIYRA